MTIDVKPVAFTPATQRKLLATLFAAQVFGGIGNAAGLAIGSVIAADLAGSDAWSGIPVGLATLGGGLASVPLSNYMGRSGRRLGLMTGHLVGALGALLCIQGIFERSFLVFTIGMTLTGVGQASNLLGRYAAADISTPEYRARAISIVVWGLTVGSLLGSNVLAVSGELAEWAGLPLTTGAFFAALVGFALAAAILAAMLNPDPADVAKQLHAGDGPARPPTPARPFAEIMAQPPVRLAIAALVLSHLVMIGTTSTMALYLHGNGHELGIIGVAVSLHLAGMYSASPISGWISDRYGRGATITCGSGMLLFSVLVAAVVPGSSSALVTLAVFLNGVGWNLAFVSGSALLTESLTPSEQARMQGIVDLFVGCMAAAASMSGGYILGTFGFPVLNLVGAVLVILPLAMSRLVNAPRRQRATAGA
jgi:MFS family permease